MDTSELSLTRLLFPKVVQSIVDAMPLGLLFLDSELNIVTLNSFLRQRLPDIQWRENKLPVAQILGQRGQQSLEIFRQVLHDGQPVTLSMRFHRAVFRLTPLPGAPLAQIPHSVTILPLYAQERVEGLAVVVQDVSDRVLAEQELTREIEKLTFLHTLDLALSTLEIGACMQTLVTRLRTLFRADFATLLELRHGKLELVVADGLPLPEPVPILDVTAGVTGWVISHRQAVNIPDVRQDARYFPLFDSIRSEMAAPLIVGGRVLGVIDLESSAPGAFSPDDLSLLEMAAYSAATALFNARTHAETDYWRTYYQGVVNQTGHMIYAVDRDLRLTSMNAAWDEFAVENDGLAWQSAVSVGRLLLDAFEGAQRAKWATICHDLLHGARRSYTEDIPCHAPDQERWLTLRAAPLYRADGEISGIIFSTQDISAHVFAERQLRAVNGQLETLLRMSHVLSQNLPNRNIPQVTVETLADLLQADCVTITVFDEREQAFKVLAAQGASERHIREFRSPRVQAGDIITQHGRTGIIYHLVDSVTTVNLPLYQADQLNGLLYSVIEHQGEILGSLNIFLRDPERRFSPEERDLVQALTPQIGLALQNARLYDQLQRLATTDGLTGLVNRRMLDDLLAREVERCRRYRRRFAVMIIDLDYFKCYNDTFGHAQGDELLRAMAQRFKDLLRAGDIPGRYGGDEFVIILPETDAPAASRIALRLQKAVAEIKIPEVEGAKCKHLTLSIGIAIYPDQADEAAALLRCADQALYRAKQLGRDRVEIHEQFLKNQQDSAIIAPSYQQESTMKKILVVDDSAFARSTVRRMLQGDGYEVYEASSGFEALELMPRVQPDLVTIDLLMPGMEGEELLGHIQDLAENCPVVVISADIQAITRQELLALGAAGFLNKPVHDEDLLPLLRKLLSQHDA